MTTVTRDAQVIFDGLGDYVFFDFVVEEQCGVMTATAKPPFIMTNFINVTVERNQIEWIVKG